MNFRRLFDVNIENKNQGVSFQASNNITFRDKLRNKRHINHPF